MESYLSPKVQILFSKACSSESVEIIFLKRLECVFVLDDISISDKLLRHFDLGKRDDNWYLDILQSLSPIFSECLNALTSKQFQLPETDEFFGWISAPHLFRGKF